MKMSRRVLLPLTAMLVAAVGLTACGSDDDSGSANTDSSSTRATSSTTAKAKATLEVDDNASLGPILVDSEGLTVYTLMADGADVPCDAACLEAWPPVLVQGEPSGGAGVTGTVTAQDGDAGRQVEYEDHPLYTFAGDNGPGDANGEGLVSFGGTWNVVKPAGGSATSPTSVSVPDGY